MRTADNLLEALRQLSKEEQKRFLARVAQLRLHDFDDGDAQTEEGWDAVLSLAGTVDRGKVRVPFPDRAMLYEDE